MTLRNLSLGAGLLALSLGAWAQAAPIKTYIVQLSDAPVATYTGGVAGIAATKPQAGAKLDMAAAPVRSYEALLAQKRAGVLAAVGNVRVLHTYTTVLNGFSAQLTDAQARRLRVQPGVSSVIETPLVRLATTHTPAFLGVAKPGGLWSKLDAQSRPVKGEDVIIGVLDSGIWPEDPSFGDKVDANGKPVAYDGTGTPAFGPPPARWKGSCQTGEGFTAAMCNNKLIGARYYVEGFGSNNGLDPQEFRSPRNGPRDDGHGAHTAGTAGGNANVDAVIDGIFIGTMSGMAPRARIAAYKVCWVASNPANTGCNPADVAKAIDDAVKDGVDILNYSVAGPSPLTGPIETAFLNAAVAGVFSATAAGNSGPGNYVANPGPWHMTVAASTHDRLTVAPLILGDGQRFSGPSYQIPGVPSSPLILAANAGLRPFDALTAPQQEALASCFTESDRAEKGISGDAALDPAKTAGHIVVCLRGGNALIDKSAAVRSANGAAMVILNKPGGDDTVYNQYYYVPSVHLASAAYPAVTAYAATPAPTASLGPRVTQGNVIAPVMTNFSSRGPNLADADILKPEISAPGFDVIAPWIDTSLTQAQHDAVAANQFRPQANAASESGTSMATPHVAGAAALIKQLHPNWSPSAISSALMTTAGTILLANGQPDPDRFGYGAGHLNPNAAADPGLVYETAPADYGRYLCGRQLTPPRGLGTCTTLGSIRSAELNLPSISLGHVAGVRTIQRTVTNVGPATSTYVASASMPGWDVKVSPPTLTLAPGASASFSVSVSSAGAAIGAWAFGHLVWSDGSHKVTTPLSARAAPFSLPDNLSDQRSSGRGTKVYTVTSNYTGALSIRNSGLLTPKRTPKVLTENAIQCDDLTVAKGTRLLRLQVFPNDVVLPPGASMPTLALLLTDSAGSIVASGGTVGQPGSDVTLRDPAEGSYSLCAFTPIPAPGVAYTLSSWAFEAGTATLPLRSAGPSSVFAGGTASIALGWNVPIGQRYLGWVELSDPASKALGSTVLLIDAQ